MPFRPTRAGLTLSGEDRERLMALDKSRTAPHAAKMRAQVLLGYAERRPLAALSRSSGLSLAAVNRCINKALSLGVTAALEDLPRSGRPPRIPPEARLWVVELACRKPTELGYPAG